jgi:hypothetical protein
MSRSRAHLPPHLCPGPVPSSPSTSACLVYLGPSSGYDLIPLTPIHSFPKRIECDSVACCPALCSGPVIRKFRHVCVQETARLHSILDQQQ